MFTRLVATCVVAILVAFASNGSSAKKPSVQMIGETVALFGIQPKALLHPIDKISAVYSFDASGRRIDYVEGRDFRQVNGMVARTEASSIFDFDQYKIHDDGRGRFEWVDEPRNPPRVLHFQAFVDYTAMGTVPDVSGLARQSIKGRVVLAGDSIAAGVDTIKSESFGHLLERHVDGITVVNAGRDGAYLDALRRNLDQLLADKPAAFVLEFGMNDQDSGFAKLRSFETRLEHAVRKIQFAGVPVILVGFPQNNKQWIRADPAVTLGYNNAIRRVAERSRAPFVDIWAKFEKLGSRKDVALDVFGDAFHHPNDFGQRVYFSAIVPHFLVTTRPAHTFGSDYVPIVLGLEKDD